MERRLAAILAADVVGYSRLMGEDEAGTLARLKACRKELVTPAIAAHRGRIVKLMGDGLLAEFASAVEAAQCAVDIQNAMAEYNRGLADGQRIDLRIGINLGDIIVEEDDIYGNGVNIAARLQALAEPGGICLSQAVHSQVAGKIDGHMDDLGDVRVKNIAEPVRVYRIALEDAARKHASAVPIAAGRSHRAWAAGGAVLAVAIAVVIGFAIWRDPAHAPDPSPTRPRPAPVAVDQMALPLPSQPSIAVLPFRDVSGDRHDEHFERGLALVVVSDLASISGLFVIAGESSLRFDDTPQGISDAARSLGVRHVLTGTVQRSGERLRVDVAVIDAVAGETRRSAMPDGSMATVRQEIAGAVGDALNIQLPDAASRAGSGPKTGSAAFGAYARGLSHLHGQTPDDHALALQRFREAVRLDPDFAAAYAGQAWSEVLAIMLDWADQPAEALKRAERSIGMVMTRGGEEGSTRRILGALRLARGDMRSARDELGRALAENPNDADALALAAKALAMLGSAEEGIEHGLRALRLNPYPPAWYYWHLGIAHYLAGRPDDAAEFLARARSLNQEARVFLAASHVAAKRLDEARHQAREILAADTRFSINEYLGTAPLPDGEIRARMADALQAAGLPVIVRWECLVRNECP